ncbi:MAG: hypothetical protein KDE14_15565, partial [Rhodobacteraceae bacterium]|nr:hypothetical protein [Paracoccaceae bacterium]
LPGLIPAFLFAFTVKEPTRLGQAALVKGRATAAETRKFIADNRLALGGMLMAGALVILEIYGAAYWHPSLFVRVYEWTPSDYAFYVAMPQGFCGIVSAYTSATLTEYFKRKGHPEGVWFTMFIGVVGCTVFGGLAPLMPEASYALPLLYAKSLFVNYPPAAAMTAVNEVTPNEHRGFVTSLYVILTGLVAQGLGPFSVGFTTDNVFGDPLAIGQSVSLIVFITGAAGAILLLYARSAYRSAVLNVSWEPAVKA